MSGAGGGIRIPNDKIIAILRRRGFEHKSERRRVHFWKLPGSGTLIDVPKRSWFTEQQARKVLAAAGLSSGEIDDFVASIGQPK